MSMTLHTHHASRIWHGRAPTEGRPGIIGLNGFIGAMNKMKRGAEQDDPYSDWWMLRIEDKLADTKTRLQTLGLELLQDGDKVTVDMVDMGSVAADLGFDFDQQIVSVKAPVERWAKEWMWLPALALLLLVIGMQWPRRQAGSRGRNAGLRAEAS